MPDDITTELDDEDQFDDEDELDFEEYAELTKHDLWLKWIAEGATNLGEVTEILRDYASHLGGLVLDGYELATPVDNGHVAVRRRR